MAPEEYAAWYAGKNGNWSVGAQHIATTGPRGLRIGMLSKNAPDMQEYMRMLRYI